MTQSVWPALFAIGALVALTASWRYRLPPGLRYATSGWGLAAALWPMIIPAIRVDRWDLAACIGATAVCAIAIAHASRTGLAQLRPGWSTELEQWTSPGSRP